MTSSCAAYYREYKRKRRLVDPAFRARENARARERYRRKKAAETG